MESDELATLIKLDLDLQGVGVTFEPKLSNRITSELSLGMGGGDDIYGGFTYEWALLRPAFYLSLTPKYNYGRKRRLERGKTVSLNAGSYIGFRLKYATSGVARYSPPQAVMLTNMHWEK